jgi:hypothetical protein
MKSRHEADVPLPTTLAPLPALPGDFGYKSSAALSFKHVMVAATTVVPCRELTQPEVPKCPKKPKCMCSMRRLAPWWPVIHRRAGAATARQPTTATWTAAALKLRGAHSEGGTRLFGSSALALISATVMDALAPRYVARHCVVNCVTSTIVPSRSLNIA